ncbi:MAG: hypothetical protein JZU50_02805 [Desulfobulbaceae bacterium]|nr:hypothetical protein [Desulfobulbaceae bacterium]
MWLFLKRNPVAGVVLAEGEISDALGGRCGRHDGGKGRLAIRDANRFPSVAPGKKLTAALSFRKIRYIINGAHLPWDQFRIFYLEPETQY